MNVTADYKLGGSLIPANSTVEYTVPMQPAPIGAAVHITPFSPLDASWAGLIWTAAGSRPQMS